MARRFKRTERRGIHFTKRDGAIVEAVFYARYLTNRQVARLFFEDKVSSSCKYRIRCLYDRKYLSKRDVYPNEPDIYYLGVRGRHYIAKALDGYSQEEVNKMAGVGGEGEAPVLMMKHDLTMSGLYANAVMQCREHGWVLEWQNARVLELKRLGVQPDAHFRVTGEGLDKRAFIEFTSVLPTHTEMRQKLEGYRALLESLAGVPILWFTTSKSKLEQLARWINEWIYHDWILLGLIEDDSEFLTRKMWRWSEKDELVQFIRPCETILYGREIGCPRPPSGVRTAVARLDCEREL